MGNRHAGVVLSDGTAYTWGYILHGKLGHSKKLLNPDLDLRSYKARSSLETDIVKEPL
jgi:alpha-tubulin suppressor-like RCC1 family protein